MKIRSVLIMFGHPHTNLFFLKIYTSGELMRIFLRLA